MLLSHGLRRAGFLPIEASDGQVAIEKLDEETFAALVLDLMMPRVDGFGVVDHLSRTQPLMIEKTVVVTAFPKAAVSERLHHVCSIVSKPFDLSEVVTRVRDCSAK
jgi:DNA-binding response OmpR family regulator